MRTKFRQMANVTFVVNAQADALDSRRSAPATTTQSLYLGTITATAPSLLPLVFLPALSGFFIEHAQTLGNHPRRALLINQPAGSGPLFPFTHSAIRHLRR